LPPLNTVSEDEWEDLVPTCIKPAMQLNLMEAYSQALAYLNDVKMNDRVKMADENRKLGQGAREPTRVGANKTKEEWIVQREKFWIERVTDARTRLIDE